MTSTSYRLWCEEAGLKVGPVKASFVQYGWRGVSATQDIAANDLLLEVPEPLLISRRSADACPCLGPLLRSPRHAHLGPYQVRCRQGPVRRRVCFGHAAAPATPTRFMLRTCTRQVLSVHLLHMVSEANSSSPEEGTSAIYSSNSDGSQGHRVVRNGLWWAPYLRELPRSYTTLCCFNKETEVPELQVPYAKDVAEAAITKVEDEWREAGALMEQLGEQCPLQAEHHAEYPRAWDICCCL